MFKWLSGAQNRSGSFLHKELADNRERLLSWVNMELSFYLTIPAPLITKASVWLCLEVFKQRCGDNEGLPAGRARLQG